MSIIITQEDILSKKYHLIFNIKNQNSQTEGLGQIKGFLATRIPILNKIPLEKILGFLGSISNNTNQSTEHKSNSQLYNLISDGGYDIEELRQRVSANDKDLEFGMTQILVPASLANYVVIGQNSGYTLCSLNILPQLWSFQILNNMFANNEEFMAVAVEYEMSESFVQQNNLNRHNDLMKNRIFWGVQISTGNVIPEIVVDLQPFTVNKSISGKAISYLNKQVNMFLDNEVQLFEDHINDFIRGSKGLF